MKKGCCESLLKDSVDTKMKAKKVATVVNRLEVAQPKPRDSIRRDPVVPQSVLLRKQTGMQQCKILPDFSACTMTQLMWE